MIYDASDTYTRLKFFKLVPVNEEVDMEDPTSEYDFHLICSP